MKESIQSPYGTSKIFSMDKEGRRVEVGDTIRVLDVDERILAPLPEDEVNELRSFIGEVFTIIHINTDDSVLVEKQWKLNGGEIMGHGLAVFPDQFEVYPNAT